MPESVPSPDDVAVERLRALVRLPTIARPTAGPGPRADRAVFESLIAALPTLYPRVHSALERERLGSDPDGGPGYSLLYRWRGSDPAGAETPTMLMAHYDVVAATDEGWQHPPFAADLVEHEGEPVVWGRGAIDDKGALAAVLEAVERLLEAGFTPRHDVLLVFGHDEEVAGTGAQAVAAVLAERGIRPALVLDEGGAIVRDAFPGLDEPFALIGVTEKGITTLRLRVQQLGGHAASPPPFAATERLARAILRLNARPSRARLDPTIRRMLRTLGARARQPFRSLFTRTDLNAPLILRALLRRGSEITALLRTTRAVTELRAGHAANALPESAEATVNVRIAPWSSVAEAVDEVRQAIADELIEIEVLQPSEPSPVSPAEGEAWDDLVASIHAVHPGLLVSPYVMMQASDSRFMTGISDHVYRFTPFRLSADERACLHAKNERIRVSAFLEGVRGYEALLRRR
ncbi:M20/M25/M40 family metallo-hydrolase [Microcella sp.]|uniref:M20/M25/M40 family metallo-hydrolase n=1 Tax=Microcella sp. TaxID=1913979 RepID=UPI00299F5CF1|nr:M20/M25/M40 family metallo-hydrolase [Microcella sp.]MDX2025322.1 M20/M25/M40 family metallo-hydrolase [Microcella sp.]